MCWALRRGRLHRTENLCSASLCQIMPKPDDLLCLPMMAQGETLGVIHMRADKPSGISSESVMLNEQLAITCTEHIALALANLKLRETLRNQSIRDPLTGLFNRRYMDETLERELQRAARTQVPLGVIMMDIDHFKKYNDMYGHDAGDAVLREVGALLQNHIRGSDIACRYGGEEFILILPETPLEVIEERAETLHSKVKQISVHHQGQLLGSISLSLGVAHFPEHETTTDGLLRVADQALYQAKQRGRDQVVIAKKN